MTYFTTFSRCGTLLYGDESGSVDRTREFDPHRAAAERSRNQPADGLQSDGGAVVLDALGGVCWRRGWNLPAAHARGSRTHCGSVAAGGATTLSPTSRSLYNGARSGKSLGGPLRYLVAGAAGFIGSHLCDRLLEAGHEVVGVDNFLTGRPANVDHLRANPRFSLIRHDIVEPIAIPGSVDVVMNLASPASPKDFQEYSIETLRVGSEGTRTMLEIARAHGARFLLASTSECYGDPLEHPQVETYWGNVNPVGPRSCYDEAKRYAEALTMAYHRRYGLKTAIARIFNTYGPRMKLDDGRIVPAFIDQALRHAPITVFGSGSQTRSFCYVSDLVEGLIRLVHADEPYPVNLGNPREMTVLEFAEHIRDATGAESEIVFEPLPEDDPQRRQPDITKARRLLGWEPRVDLDEGLRRTIEWFRQAAPVPGPRP